jgi:hypothetical protein
MFGQKHILQLLELSWSEIVSGVVANYKQNCKTTHIALNIFSITIYIWSNSRNLLPRRIFSPRVVTHSKNLIYNLVSEHFTIVEWTSASDVFLLHLCFTFFTMCLLQAKEEA